MRRRDFARSSLSTALACLLSPLRLPAKGESTGGNRRLLKPVHDQIVCPWQPGHPRHDHQLIFPLDQRRLLLVWSEYYSQSKAPATKKGFSGAGDHVACQISSLISTDQGRSWGARQVLQPNRWKQNVKHPNLIRLSEQEILFSYVGWDDASQRNIYLRRSTDNGKTWGEQRQISEPGWYCCNADHALRLRSGRVLIPAHGPYAKKYVGGTSYKGGNLHSFVFYSDDGFRTWKRSADSMTAPGRGCHEPAIVKRIPSTGDLLLLWNNVASPSNWPRTPLTAAISKNEGKTWGHFQDIDARETFDAAYPSVTFIGDEALIAYYSRSTRWKRDSEITLRIYQISQFYR
ncbi:sialidase family protein [Gimesia sp.]|mgnify:CR=1 FL=1|uniref:sialidase family protein n=1 Tax=Gimesia sp. TaxID=2024833 RepID=UPI000C41C34E|nr:sialidase family protein [Gimesia sp.]MAX38963.1 hypothetical protein [Gimesia sp.]